MGDGGGTLGDVGITSHAGRTWAGRRVLVTGAAGLLGGWVDRAFIEAGAAVVGLDIAWQGPVATEPAAGVQVVDGDVRELEVLYRLLAEERIDTVIHLAAQTLVGPAVDDPIDTFSHNIAGTWSLLEACRRAGSVRSVVVASSDKAYGDAGGRPYRETMALRPHHPYDMSKAAADLLTQTYAHTYGLPAAIIRCGNLYGGGDLNWSRIVPGTVRSVLEGNRPVIRSDGSLVRDYLYVRDAAVGVMSLAAAIAGRPETFRGEAFNFAGGARFSVREIVHRVLSLMDSSLEPTVEGRRLPEIPEQRVSASKARRILGWRPQTPVNRGLLETIAWYRDHLGARA